MGLLGETVHGIGRDALLHLLKAKKGEEEKRLEDFLNEIQEQGLAGVVRERETRESVRDTSLVLACPTYSGLSLHASLANSSSTVSTRRVK